MGVEDASFIDRARLRHGIVVPQAPAMADRRALLVEIADHAALRREVGIAAMHDLGLQLAICARAACPTALVEQLSPSRVLVVEAGSLAGTAAQIEYRLRRQSGDRRLRLRSVAEPVAPSESIFAALERAEQALDLSARRERPSLWSDGLAAELPRALEREETFLAYQPKVRLRDRQVAGLEALIRWRHPRRGTILPGAFIEAAEQGGQIAALTRWTIKRAITDQRWLASAGYDLPVHINVAGPLLGDIGFVAEACATIRAADAPIGFEITETSVIQDPAVAIRNLAAIAEAGIAISIDDYGSGLSSLAYLKQLPATELKIDKLFITELTSTNKDPLIVRSTIDLAHALDMAVVAEGVETPAVLALLAVMGCDLVQGYHLGYPLDREQTLIALRDRIAEQAADVSKLRASPFKLNRAC